MSQNAALDPVVIKCVLATCFNPKKLSAMDHCNQKKMLHSLLYRESPKGKRIDFIMYMAGPNIKAETLSCTLPLPHRQDQLSFSSSFSRTGQSSFNSPFSRTGQSSGKGAGQLSFSSSFSRTGQSSFNSSFSRTGQSSFNSPFSRTGQSSFLKLCLLFRLSSSPSKLSKTVSLFRLSWSAKFLPSNSFLYSFLNSLFPQPSPFFKHSSKSKLRIEIER